MLRTPCSGCHPGFAQPLKTTVLSLDKRRALQSPFCERLSSPVPCPPDPSPRRSGAVTALPVPEGLRVRPLPLPLLFSRARALPFTLRLRTIFPYNVIWSFSLLSVPFRYCVFQSETPLFRL